MKNEDIARVYRSAEDTLLLIDTVKQYEAECVLEIGIGSGLVFSELVKKNNLAVGVDININAVRETKRSMVTKSVRSRVSLLICDSASPFREKIFDLVVFNPPYLPCTNIVDLTVDGGVGGVEISKAWLREVSRCLRQNGRIVFVTSSLSNIEDLLSYTETIGFEVEILKSLHLFFEELYIIEAMRSQEDLGKNES